MRIGVVSFNEIGGNRNKVIGQGLPTLNSSFSLVTILRLMCRLEGYNCFDHARVLMLVCQLKFLIFR